MTMGTHEASCPLSLSTGLAGSLEIRGHARPAGPRDAATCGRCCRTAPPSASRRHLSRPCPSSRPIHDAYSACPTFCRMAGWRWSHACKHSPGALPTGLPGMCAAGVAAPTARPLRLLLPVFLRQPLRVLRALPLLSSSPCPSRLHTFQLLYPAHSASPPWL